MTECGNPTNTLSRDSRNVYNPDIILTKGTNNRE